jgi:hypothetical protein
MKRRLVRRAVAILLAVVGIATTVAGYVWSTQAGLDFAGTNCGVNLPCDAAFGLALPLVVMVTGVFFVIAGVLLLLPARDSGEQ